MHVTKKEEDTSSKKPADMQLHSGKQIHEVAFDNYFGSNVKELLKTVFAYSADKTAQCLLGPKLPVYGFEQVVNSVGMKLVRSDPWDENAKTGSMTRKFIYSIRHSDNVFHNTEIVEQTQTYTVKKYV